MFEKIQKVWKAAVGLVAPAVPLIIAAVQEDSPGGSSVTGPEWVAIAAACVVTGSAVYLAPKNRPAYRGAANAEPVE